jgi:cytochrome P450
MLMELLKPDADPTILPRLIDELRQAEQADGSVDVAVLVAQPLLQSVWTETLRMYTDILVTRNLPEDITLPLDEDGTRQVLFRKGDNCFAPSWLGQHDANVWSEKAPYNQWYAERFYHKDPETGKGVFSMNGSNGKFFPFGGGRTICPGRVFAKQEGLGALALILLRFEFEVKGFIGADGQPASTFPGFAKSFPGSGALIPGGDMMVTVKRRTK